MHRTQYTQWHRRIDRLYKIKSFIDMNVILVFFSLAVFVALVVGSVLDKSQKSTVMREKGEKRSR